MHQLFPMAQLEQESRLQYSEKMNFLLLETIRKMNNQQDKEWY